VSAQESISDEFIAVSRGRPPRSSCTIELHQDAITKRKGYNATTRKRDVYSDDTNLSSILSRSPWHGTILTHINSLNFFQSFFSATNFLASLT